MSIIRQLGNRDTVRLFKISAEAMREVLVRKEKRRQFLQSLEGVAPITSKDIEIFRDGIRDVINDIICSNESRKRPLEELEKEFKAVLESRLRGVEITFELEKIGISHWMKIIRGGIKITYGGKNYPFII